MGADGSIVICTREDFDANNPGVNPQDMGLYTGKFLGQECCWGYFGDNINGSNYYTEYGSWWSDFYWRDLTEEQIEKVKQASRWFEANAEVHEVWT